VFNDTRFQALLEELEPQQRRFVQEYLKDFNATAAAVRAGYSAKTARQQGSRLLQQKPVKDTILAGQLRLADGARDSVAEFRNRLTSMAFPSVTDFLDEKGNLLPPYRWPPGAEQALQSLKVRSSDDGTTVVKLKLHNRPRALARVKALVDAIDNKLLSDEERNGRMSPSLLNKWILSNLSNIFYKGGLRVIDREGRTINLETFEVGDGPPCLEWSSLPFEKLRYKDALRGLSPQYRRFVEEYLRDFNAPAAAMRAGYSAKSARHQACRLMRYFSINTAIVAGQHLQDDWAKETGAKLHEKLTAIGFIDVTKFFDEPGIFLPPDRWPPGGAHAVEAITIRFGKNGCVVEALKFTNKVSALSMLYDHLTAMEARQAAKDERMASFDEEAILRAAPGILRDVLKDLGYRLVDAEGRLIFPAASDVKVEYSEKDQAA
jgi:phage terminase small subunit